jgi:TetR/AcrR family transcriptional regulator, cholesterol catabolism regulator
VSVTASQETIVAAAAGLFRRKGFAATTMRDIADAVGLSKAGVYHHYQSKEQLLKDVFDTGTQALMAQLRDVQERDLTPVEKLELFVRTRMEAISSHQDMLTVIWQERPTIDGATFGAVVAELERYRAGVTELIEAAQAAGELRDDVDPHLLMLALDGMTGWSYLWLRPAGEHAPASIGEQFWTYVWMGVRGEAAS